MAVEFRVVIRLCQTTYRSHSKVNLITSVAHSIETKFVKQKYTTEPTIHYTFVWINDIPHLLLPRGSCLTLAKTKPEFNNGK